MAEDKNYIKGSSNGPSRTDKILIETLEDFASYSKIPFSEPIEFLKQNQQGIKMSKELGYTEDGFLYLYNSIDSKYKYVDPNDIKKLELFLQENDLIDFLYTNQLYVPFQIDVDKEILTKEEILKLPDIPVNHITEGQGIIRNLKEKYPDELIDLDVDFDNVDGGRINIQSLSIDSDIKEKEIYENVANELNQLANKYNVSINNYDDNPIHNFYNIIDTPTNVVDEGIELFHSISKGGTINKNFHAGTYNAALDRASQFYGGEQLYKIANDNLDFIQEQANDLVYELSEEVSFEKVENFYEVTDGMVTREIDITLPTGVEASFNIVAETSNNDLTVKFQDLDGYDGAEIYSETLWDIEYEPDNLKSVTSTIDIINDENVAEGFLDEIGLKSQAGDFNYKDGYDLYKVNIKPGANVVNIPDTVIFVEFGIEKKMSSDFIQGFIERPQTVNKFTNVTQIKIGGKTYDITDTFTSAQALQEHFKDADILVYTNDIEDVGSKSYMFLNENSYVLEKIDDAQFNIDVANKYIKNNPYETISTLSRKEAFTEPERYKVLLNALLDETDTPTNVVDDFVITQDRFGRDVTVPVDNNGNIILYRATDDPNRIIDSDFRPLSRDKGSVGLGQQSYFSPNPMYSHKYQSSGRKNYKFATQIKPNQILPTDDIVKNYPELVNALNIPEEFTNQNWRQLVNDNKAMIAMGYETGGKRFFNDNIQTFINNGIQAFGSGSTGTGGQTFIEYEIIPLVKEGDTLGIKPIATLQTKEGFAAGKVPEAFTETSLDTPDRPFGPGAAYIDEIALSTESFVDNLPLETGVKDLFLSSVDNRLKRLARQVATPGGILDAVDIWEIGVLALVAGAIAFNEIDEIPKITKNAILRTYNLSQGRPIDAPLRVIGLPVLSVSEYDIDFEYAMETLEKGEKVMPTDIIIKELAESSLEKGEPAVLPGTGVTATTGIDEEFAPYKESIIKEREETANIKRDEVKQKLLESKGVQEEKMFEQTKPKKSSGGAGAKIL